MKERKELPEEEKNEREERNMLEKEFKVMALRVIKQLSENSK